ncbi:MAG: hypothetical protein GY834_16400 [Bacteroidetes bacterium]|nr:hypothetical protein [Bacteroidota bacterium]
MSRFKEKRRIDRAIKEQNLIGLKWALDYCKIRLEHSSMKVHQKHWKKYIVTIKKVIEGE